MKKKHILVVSGAYPPSYGGGGLRLHRTYKRLSKLLPINITALTTIGRGQWSRCNQYEGFTVWRISQKKYLYAQLIETGWFFITHVLSRFDLIHSAGNSLISISACFWAHLFGIPIVREMTLNRDIPQVRGFYSLLLRLSYKRANLLVALSEAIKKQYRLLRIPEERIWLRPNPVDTSIFRVALNIERLKTRAAHGVSESDIVHILIGRFEPRKNQLFAMKTLTYLPSNHKLILVGPMLKGDEPYVQVIQDFISRNKIENRVILVTKHIFDIVNFYHAADTCLMPSQIEGMPNVMLESLCCGVPVIINEALGMNQHVLDGFNGFNIALDPVGFAQAAKKVLFRIRNDHSRQKIAEKAVEKYGSAHIDRAFARHLARLLNITSA